MVDRSPEPERDRRTHAEEPTQSTGRPSIYGGTRRLPPPSALPRWLQPLPTGIETLGLRLVWLVVLINLLGTIAGFVYYLPQFEITAPVMWPFVPDSPLATLFIAGAFALWALGRPNEYLTTLAFIGNLKLGLWTPWVLLVFSDAFLTYTPVPLYGFLVVSHLGMAVQALVVHRIGTFRLDAIAVAVVWYTVDLTVDWFIPLVGEPHHTILPVADSMAVFGGATAFQVSAWAAVVLTILAVCYLYTVRVLRLREDTNA